MNHIPLMAINSSRIRWKRLMYRIDMDPENMSLLSQDEPEGPDPGTGEHPIIEGYVSTSDFSSPIARKSRDTTSLSGNPDPTDDPMIGDKEPPDHITVLKDANDIDKKLAELVPSSVVNYYNETALKSKKRNTLPDSEFGLPRLRAYPLNDKAHVKQAIRMFGHCKDPEDRKVLAGNIFKAVEKYGVTVKIGKRNPLYAYAPKALQEAASKSQGLSAISIGTPIENRTKDDIVREHLMINRSFYNNIFYGPEYAKSAKAITGFRFLDFFYPDITRMSFQARLECVCGGLAGGGSREEIYAGLGIRNPLCTDFTKELGWCTSGESDEAVDIFVNSNYVDTLNWFKVDLSDDPDHVLFCLRLYSVMGEILLDPNFNPDINLTDRHLALLMDWNQRVGYHYDLYLDANNPDKQLREIQYLFDLFWSFTDNPHSESDADVNVIGMLRTMACIENTVVNMNEANDSGEIVTREKCNSYLIHDLGMDDTLYLLPDSMEYPIITKESVRLAMDMIGRVEKSRRKLFSKNLNQKYKEFGCTFSISVDHPYAPYADKNIVQHMTRVLLEGKTAVDDQGTSTSNVPLSERPWYKHLDVVRGVADNILDNKELGPNTKKQQEPDYTQYDSVL